MSAKNLIPHFSVRKTGQYKGTCRGKRGRAGHNGPDGDSGGQCCGGMASACGHCKDHGQKQWNHHGDGAAEETHETAQQNQDASDRGLGKVRIEYISNRAEDAGGFRDAQEHADPAYQNNSIPGDGFQQHFFFISQAQQSADHCSDNGQHLDIEQSGKALHHFHRVQSVEDGGNQDQGQYSQKHPQSFFLYCVQLFRLFDLAGRSPIAFKKQVDNDQGDEAGNKHVYADFRRDRRGVRREIGIFDNSADDDSRLAPGNQSAGSGTETDQHQQNQVMDPCTGADHDADRSHKGGDGRSGGSQESHEKGQKIQNKRQKFCPAAKTVNNMGRNDLKSAVLDRVSIKEADGKHQK